jgi:hypothetical protein
MRLASYSLYKAIKEAKKQRANTTQEICRIENEEGNTIKDKSI